MKANTMEQIHFELVRLSALLRTLHVALPDDLMDSETDTRFMVGWACQLAQELANDVDLLDLSQCRANGEIERTHIMSN